MALQSKSLLRSALFLVLLVGLSLMLWPVGQMTYGWWNQRLLRQNWDKVAQNPAVPRQDSTKFAPAKLAKPQNQNALPDVEKKKTPAPFPPTRIFIPDINVDAVVVQGMGSTDLQRGPGHEPNSATPGQIGNCVIAAHSNIFGAWFGDLDQLWAGSVIELHTPRRIYSYIVLTSTQVSEADTSVLLPPTDGKAHLTLITCTKPASIYRHVVTAILDGER